MKIIGITGRSGSGKSAVSALYRQLGYTVADADRVARQVLEPGSPCLAKLAAAFGPDAFTAQGAVDRQKLAARAFRDETSTQTLIDITHPEIVARLLAAADEAKSRGETLFFVDGAVIVGAPFEKYCDAIWLVSAPYEQSVARIRKRDGLTLRQARARLAAQLPVRALRKVAAREIRNDKDLEHLRSQAVAALEQEKGGA
ncbi:dephospho-CoA kinase [Candidatus Allofournierella merdavium]|uniref:dephospho-CoA kinase n=1 Tax=Candidatus Allofournierella merdavium TaxID=2838593 RepID=UPI00374E2CF8